MTKMAKYAVVKFPNENSVEVVPLGWYITEAQECFWPPPGTKRLKILSHIENRDEPDSQWPVYQAILLGKYDELYTAQKKVKKAELTSDLSSNEEVVGRGFRRRKPNKKYDRDTDSESLESEDNNEYPILKPNLFGKLPALSLKPKLVRMDSAKNIDRTSPKPSTPLSCRSSQNTNDVLETPGRQSLSSPSERRHTAGTRFSQTEIVPCQREADEGFRKTVIAELSLLSLKIDGIFDKVNSINRTLVASNMPVLTRNPDVETFYGYLPIKTREDLKKFEEWLGDKDNYKLLICELSRIGGVGYAQSCRKILYRMLTNEVGDLYSWDGAKHKRAFKSLILAKGIVETLKMQFQDVTETDIINVIKIWLVKSKERIKTKENKERNKGGAPQPMEDEVM